MMRFWNPLMRLMFGPGGPQLATLAVWAAPFVVASPFVRAPYVRTPRVISGREPA